MPTQLEDKPKQIYDDGNNPGNEVWYSGRKKSDSDKEIGNLEKNFGSDSAAPKDLQENRLNDSLPKAKQGGLFSGGAKKISGKFSRKKKMVAGGALIASVTGAVALNIFLSLGSGGLLLNLDRIYEAYRIQTINRQFARRVAHISLSDSIVNQNGRPTTGLRTPGGARSLFARMGGWSSNSAMRAIGAAGVEFNFERSATGGRRLVSVTDKNTGRTISRSGSGGAATAQFTNEVADLVDQRMSDIGKNKFYRRQTANFVRLNTGIRMSKFREFLARRGENISRQDGRRILLRERIADMTAGRLFRNSKIRIINDTAQEQRATLEDGRVPDNRNERAAFGESRTRTLSRLGTVSDINLVMTMGCIANDISGQTLRVIESRVNGPVRAFADLRTKADQVRVGDITEEALAAEMEYWDGAHQSAAIQRALGTPNDQIPDRNKVTEIEYPFTLFGMELSTVQKLAYIVNAVTNPLEAVRNALGFGGQEDISFDEIPDNPFADDPNSEIGSDDAFTTQFGDVEDGASAEASSLSFCDALLHPAGQTAIGVGELAATVFSLGSIRAATTAITSSWRVAARIAGGASISYVLYYRVIPAYIDNLNGIDSMPIPGQGPQNGNKIDIGALIYKNSLAAASGATIIPGAVALEQQRESIALYKQQERSKGALYGYFSFNNPFSLTSRLAYTLNGFDGQAFGVSLMKNVSSIFNPTRYLSKAYANNSVYPLEEEFYGMQDVQFGWENNQIDGSDSRFEFTENTVYVETNFERLNREYSECFTKTMYDVASNGYPDNCQDEDARRYGMYYLDCLSVDQVMSEDPIEGTYNSRSCDYIIETLEE